MSCQSERHSIGSNRIVEVVAKICIASTETMKTIVMKTIFRAAEEEGTR